MSTHVHVISPETFNRLTSRRTPEPGIYVPADVEGHQQILYAVYIDEDGHAFTGNGVSWSDADLLCNYAHRGGLHRLRYAD